MKLKSRNGLRTEKPKRHENERTEKPKRHKNERTESKNARPTRHDMKRRREKSVKRRENEEEVEVQRKRRFKIPKRKSQEQKIQDDLVSLIYENSDLEMEDSEGELSVSDLSEIEKEYKTDEKVGPKIAGRLETFVNTLKENRLSDEKMKEKIEKYKQPENFKLQVPRVNPELWSKLDHNTRNDDFALQKIQRAVVKTTICAVRTCDLVREKKSAVKKDVLPMLADTISMNLKTIHDISMERRRRIVTASKLDKQLASVDTPVSDLLWDDLSSVIEAVKSNSKLTQMLSNAGREQNFRPCRFQSQNRYGYGHYQRGATKDVSYQYQYQRGQQFMRGRTNRGPYRGRGQGRGWQKNNQNAPQATA